MTEKLPTHHEAIVLDDVNLDSETTKRGVMKLVAFVNVKSMPTEIKGAIAELTDEGVFAKLEISRRIKEGEAADDAAQTDAFQGDGDDQSEPAEDSKPVPDNDGENF